MCVLSEALRANAIDATVFEPFVIAELGGAGEGGMQTTEFVVTLQDIGTAGTQTHRLRLQWHGASALQGKIRTEEP